jgi:DNA-binding transcriptional LysR family regulator
VDVDLRKLRYFVAVAEQLLQEPGTVPGWRDIATELRAVAGRGPEPVFRSVEEKLEHVAAGDGIIIVPLSTTTFYTRPAKSLASACIPSMILDMIATRATA